MFGHLRSVGCGVEAQRKWEWGLIGIIMGAGARMGETVCQEQMTPKSQWLAPGTFFLACAMYIRHGRPGGDRLPSDCLYP